MGIIIGLICLFYDALLQMADCNHNTRANQTVSAESHAIPAYKSDAGLKYDSKIELWNFEC